MLEDCRSHIKYSQISFVNNKLDRQWHRWRSAHIPIAMAIRTCSTSTPMMLSWNLTATPPTQTRGGISTISSFFSLERVFFSAPYMVRFFFSGFSRLFFHPPSIFPTSSSFLPNSIYCL